MESSQAESNQAPFTEMFYYASEKKNDKIAGWLYTTLRKNVLLPPLPIEICRHIVDHLEREAYMSTHKYSLRKWLYNNDDGSIPVHPGKLLQQ